MTVLSFLPFITCLFWLVLAPLLSKRNANLLRLEVLLFFIAASALAHTTVNISYSETSRIVLFLTDQFATTSVIPLALSYISHLKRSDSKGKQSLYIVWLVFPVSLLFVDITLTMLSGTETFLSYLTDFRNGFTYSMATDKVEHITYLCSAWVFNTMLAIEAIVFITRTFFSSKQRHIQSYNLTFLILIYTLRSVSYYVLNTDTVWHSLLFPVLLTASIFLIALTGLFHNNLDLTYSDLLKGITPTTDSDGYDTDDNTEPSAYNNMDRIRALAIPREQDESVNPAIVDAHLNRIDDDRLRLRFEELIIKEQLFLKQGIHISDIAAKLDTNRTYVSRLVNNTYHMSFSDYINTLRIDYAKQYLLHHKDAKQSDLSALCGFPNASSFNNIFKKVTGVTPKIWLATNNHA